MGWAENLTLGQTGGWGALETGIPAGFFPVLYGIREFGRENLLPDFVPVLTGFPGNFPVSYFSYKNGI